MERVINAVLVSMELLKFPHDGFSVSTLKLQK